MGWTYDQNEWKSGKKWRWMWCKLEDRLGDRGKGGYKKTCKRCKYEATASRKQGGWRTLNMPWQTGPVCQQAKQRDDDDTYVYTSRGDTCVCVCYVCVSVWRSRKTLKSKVTLIIKLDRYCSSMYFYEGWNIVKNVFTNFKNHLTNITAEYQIKKKNFVHFSRELFERQKSLYNRLQNRLLRAEQASPEQATR